MEPEETDFLTDDDASSEELPPSELPSSRNLEWCVRPGTRLDKIPVSLVELFVAVLCIPSLGFGGYWADNSC